jgi:hypothetical protein
MEGEEQIGQTEEELLKEIQAILYAVEVRFVLLALTELNRWNRKVLRYQTKTRLMKRKRKRCFEPEKLSRPFDIISQFHAFSFHSNQLRYNMSAYSSSGEEDDQDYSDWTEEDETPTRSLFGEETFKTAHEALDHDARVHGVELVSLAQRLSECLAL